MTVKSRVLDALSKGEELTAKQISSRYSVVSPRGVISDLRKDGYAIYLNERTNSKGRTTRKYRLGSPSKSMVASAAAAGFFAS